MGVEKALLEEVPVVLALANTISRYIDAKDDEGKQLEALLIGAEAIKRRLDQLKFPTESEG